MLWLLATGLVAVASQPRLNGTPQRSWGGLSASGCVVSTVQLVWNGRTACILRSQHVRCKMGPGPEQPSRRGCDTEACACTGTRQLRGRGPPLSAASRRYLCHTKLKRSILTAPLHQLPWPLSGAPVTQPTPHIHRVFHTHGATFHARLSPAARPSPVAGERGCMHDGWS